MSTFYHPELDVSKELLYDNANYFQSLIGVLHWAIKIGRADIATEVLLLTSHLAMP